MKKSYWPIMLMICAAAAFGQNGGNVQVGVCIDLENLETAQAAGFDYLEINVSRVAGLSEEDFQKLQTRVAQLRIPISAANVFLPGNLKIVGPEANPERQLDYVRKALRRMKQLGVSVVVLGSGGARRVPDGFSHEAAFTQLVEFCQRIAPVAAENGIVMAVEPLRHQETNIINTAKEGLRLVKAVDRPQIKLLVDYYHLAEESESAEIIAEARNIIVHTHIANPKGRVYPLSADESDYAPFFENLCRIRYSARLSIEASTKDFATQAPRSLAMLRSALSCVPK